MTQLDTTPKAAARYDIPAFVAELDALAATGLDHPALARAAADRLPRVLATPDVLAPEFRAPWPDRYRPHLVMVAPSGAFSVVALVWLPGQVTPIHDHICWCVVGVLEGIEREERFHLLAGAEGERWLCPAGEEGMTRGATAVLVPPDENIHRVRNAGAALAISLHVYGADLRVVPSHSSVNECFDALAIRADATGTPVPWRARD